MALTHQALKSFSATLKFSVKQTDKIHGEKTQNASSEISYILPNKVQTFTTAPVGLDGKAPTLRVISDGKTLYALQSDKPNTYHSQPAAPDIKNIIAGLRMSGVGTGLMGILLTEKQASNRILGPDTTLVEFAPDETIEGTACRVINAVLTPKQGAPLSLTFAYGKEDNLLRRVTISNITAESGFAATEIYANVKANPELSPTLFSYTPAPDAKKEDEQEEAYYDARLKVGADPLPFSGKDMSGAPVSLAAYKGKVVLLDFWATWCGPCVAEIPNVVKVYNKYHSKGFDVIGVSLDKADSKEKVASFTKANNMPWLQIYDGGYWQSALATAYSIKAIPFTLLIGKDGKIAAVAARGEELEPAVKKALAAQ
jgi:peroxiredoxin/outer membrane lipoprotein-sorting protein